MTSPLKTTYILRGKQRLDYVKTAVFNIDNGAGTTIDDILFSNLPMDIIIDDVRAVYNEATDTAGAASANFCMGIALADATIVAATPLAVSKAIGSTTPGTILIPRIAAGSFLVVRHTGVASTEVGTYYVQVAYHAAP